MTDVTAPPAATAASLPKPLAAHPLVSQWIDFASPGLALVRTGRVELGQGNVTAIAQVAADELDLRMDQVVMVAGDTTATPDEGVTSGSQSMETGALCMRLAASAARALLLREAAALLGAREDELSASEGIVLRGGKPTRCSYWTLAPRVALTVPVAAHAAPKPAHARRIAGTRQPRIDLAAKIRGGGFIHDMAMDGMLHGRVLHPPSRHARLDGADLDAVARRAGVVRVVRDGSFVGVVASSEAEAVEAIAAAARACTWAGRRDAPADPVNAMLETKAQPQVMVEKGGAQSAHGRRFETVVSRPYLLHASIGPSCALAHWHGDRLRVWTHSQGVFPLREALAKALRIESARIDVIHRDGAGCYGHNGADDVALDAALLARAVPGSPVRVLWSRAQEFASSPLGPAAVVRASAVVGDDGRMRAMSLDIVGQPYGGRPNREGRANLLAAEFTLGAPEAPPANDIAGGIERNGAPLYAIPNVRVAKRVPTELPFRTSSLRGLGAYVNVFAIETLVDEIAHELGRDALAFRLAHLEDPRARAVLEQLGKICGWGAKRPEGEGLGIAFARYKNSAAYCAVAARVAAAGEEIRVTRMLAVVDAGEAINPDGIANQVEGGMVQSASWTLKEAVRFDGDAIGVRDWDDYPILKFSETPRVQVEIIARPEEKPLGVAEAAQGPAAAAIANAVHDALGVRVRRLPITREAIIAASI